MIEFLFECIRTCLYDVKERSETSSKKDVVILLPFFLSSFFLPCLHFPVFPLFFYSLSYLFILINISFLLLFLSPFFTHICFPFPLLLPYSLLLSLGLFPSPFPSLPSLSPSFLLLPPLLLPSHPSPPPSCPHSPSCLRLPFRQIAQFFLLFSQYIRSRSKAHFH